MEEAQRQVEKEKGLTCLKCMSETKWKKLSAKLKKKKA